MFLLIMRESECPVFWIRHQGMRQEGGGIAVLCLALKEWGKLPSAQPRDLQVKTVVTTVQLTLLLLVVTGIKGRGFNHLVVAAILPTMEGFPPLKTSCFSSRKQHTFGVLLVATNSQI